MELDDMAWWRGCAEESRLMAQYVSPSWRSRFFRDNTWGYKAARGSSLVCNATEICFVTIIDSSPDWHSQVLNFWVSIDLGREIHYGMRKSIA
jgi:hypothetical protein